MCMLLIHYVIITPRMNYTDFACLNLRVFLYRLGNVYVGINTEVFSKLNVNRLVELLGCPHWFLTINKIAENRRMQKPLNIIIV